MTLPAHVMRYWRDALDGYELEPDPARALCWVGHTPGGLPIEVTLEPTRTLDVRIVTGLSGLSALAREHAPSMRGGARTGDAGLDAAVLVLGPEVNLGALDHTVRALLVTATSEGVHVRDGVIHLPTHDATLTSDVIRRLSKLGIALGDALAARLPPPYGILEVAQSDPSTSVRIRFKSLIAELDLVEPARYAAIESAVDDDGVEPLIDQLGDPDARPLTRELAAWRLLDRFPLHHIAALDAALWDAVGASPPVVRELERALRRAPSAVHGRAALHIAERLYRGALQAMANDLGEALLEAIGRDLGPEDRGWLTRLAGHPVVGPRAGLLLLDTYPLAELERLVDPAANALPRTQRGYDLVVAHVASRLDDADTPPDERPRYLDLLAALLRPPMTTALAPPVALRTVRALVHAHEPTRIALLTALAEHPVDAVAGAVARALLATSWPTAELLTPLSSSARRRLVAHAPAAVREDPSLPPARLYDLYPHAAPSLRVAYLDAIGDVGALDALPFLSVHVPGLTGAAQRAALDARRRIVGRHGRELDGALSEVATRDAAGGLTTPDGGDPA